jgi:transcriptional regulator with XRE-family HTH domain
VAARRPDIVAAVKTGQGTNRQPGAVAVSLVGQLLKQWRERRGMSQLGLAADAGISARHLSFLETGRAQPSREMVVLLSQVLDVPLRGRNELLAVAGYAPIYRETALDAPRMAQVRRPSASCSASRSRIPPWCSIDTGTS